MMLCLLVSLKTTAADLKAYPAILAPQTEWADGDSFPVIITKDGKEKIITARLYYVDCPETSRQSKTDRARLLEQYRYFGIESATEMPRFGKDAANRTRELLSKPFEVHTSFANALGRSRIPRSYTMIKLHTGEFLSAVLVKEGYARVKGKTHILLDKTHSNEFRAKLTDLELAASIDKKGIWADSTSERIIKLREEARIEAAKEKANDPFSAVTPDSPADINNDPLEILDELPGVGPATAKKIIAARPFNSVEGLLKVGNIGKKTLEKFRHLVVCNPVKK